MNKTITLNSKFQIRSEASFLDNPNVRRVSFIITDDKPNANYEGIRAAQFMQLAASAMYMPIKMAEGGIAHGHYGAIPLGVITGAEIREQSDLTQIYGEGVLWQAERPADVAYFASVTNSRGAYLSWEIAYSQEEVDEMGVTWLLDPVLLAVTIVADPAYGNRTPVTSASVNEVVMDENLVETIIEESVTVDAEEESTTGETQTEEVVTEEIIEPETADPVDEILSELEALRAYKAKVEAEKEFERQLQEVRNSLPEISEEDARILTGINVQQLQVIKTLLSSKRATSSKESREVIPELPVRSLEDPKQILVAYLSSLGGRNASQ